jgi:hypothetical protein
MKTLNGTPTTAEILAAMNKDLRHLFVKDRIAKNCAHNRGEKLFGYSPNYGREKSKVVVYTITSYQCQSCNMDK